MTTHNRNQGQAKSAVCCAFAELGAVRNVLRSNSLGVCTNVPLQKSKIAFVIKLLCLSLMILATSSWLKAQSFYGSIVGTVTDPSGAVVPGATVTGTNTGTNEANSIKSDATGKFNIANLLPANYKVEVATT